MSGGVDSSVAALLLKRKGYDVVGVFMRCWGDSSPSQSPGITPSPGLGVSCAERDAEDARRVAEHIEIPFYAWDFEEEYKRRVVDYMVAGYRKGETPNPDVECNREIKFGMFYERAMKFGADYVATGHYVRRGERIEGRGKQSFLSVAKDPNKDQSYFLWTLAPRQIARCLFPIGDYLKPRVREIARRAGLPTAEKKDSQGICFLGNVNIEDFLKQYLPARKGAVLTTDGKPVGEHGGSWFYTIGQRHGLDLSKKNRMLGVRGKAATKAHYVTAKNVRTNTITVAEGADHPALYKKDLTLRGVNLQSTIPAAELRRGVPVMARVRYRQPLSAAVLQMEGKGRYRLSFAHPQKFVAAGQSAVFYAPAEASGSQGAKAGSHNLIMLGGGIIEA